MLAASRELTREEYQSKTTEMNIKMRAIKTEILASSLALFGVIIFVLSFLPIINPSHYEVTYGNNDFGIYRYVFGGACAGAFFWFSSRFNNKAKLLRKALRDGENHKK